MLINGGVALQPLSSIRIRWIVCQLKSESLYLHLEDWVPFAGSLRWIRSLLPFPDVFWIFPIACWLSSLLPTWRILLMYKFVLLLPPSWGVLNCFYFSVFARSSKASLIWCPSMTFLLLFPVLTFLASFLDDTPKFTNRIGKRQF